MHYFILWSTQSILYSPGAQSHAILPVLYSGNVFENARTAHCDVTVWWRLMSPGSGLCRQRAMDCDLTSLAAYPRAPAEPGPAWLVPGLLPSVPARCGGWSEASPGAGWCFGGCRRQLSVPVPEPSPVFPRPCLARAAGHRGARLQQRR